jgi:hypothetical protein
VFVSEEPLRVSDWVDRWIRPLIEVATFATRKLQTVASFQVFTGGEDQTRGVVFGPGIGQAPYYSSDGRDWMTGERALFTLPSLAIEFPALLRGWRNLQHAENPFVELYRLVLIQEELPPRAKILYLLQALEALHGHEHRDEDEAAQESFELRRSEVLEAVEQQIEDRATFNFLKKNWLKRKPDSLARRLRELALSLPDAVNAQLRQTAMEAMEDQLAARDVISIEEQLQMLRNDLSHGGQNYSDQELQPWVCAVETLCQANLLRLLGFDGAAIERSLLSRP